MQIASAPRVEPTTTTTTVASAQTAPAGRAPARYGGLLGGIFPDEHWTRAWDRDGDPTAVPMVIGGPAIRRAFASINDAITAAQSISAGARHAVAVVRRPGTGDDGPWYVDRVLFNDFYRVHRWQGMNLESVLTRQPASDGYWDVFQPLVSQRSVIVGAIVDGELVLDNVERYKSTRPDLPGRDPDRPRA